MERSRLHRTRALHKVLVVGVQKDQGRPQGMGRQHGRRAQSRAAYRPRRSYQIFPDKAPSPDELASMASRDGFDGVAATHFVTASQRYPHLSRGYGYSPGWGWGPLRGLLGLLGTAVRAAVRRELTTAPTTRPMSLPWTATGGKLIWSGVTRSLDPSSTRTSPTRSAKCWCRN